MTHQILNLSVDGWILDLSVSWILFGVVLLVFFVRLSGGGPRWEVQQVSLSFIRGPAVQLVPDNKVATIAHQAWAELASRKAGIRVDDDDVIVDVYDSWYLLFETLRQLTKEVPVSALHRSSDAATLLEMLMAAMNEGLRPHLTEHQARFRSWWAAADQTMSPQERQRTYPKYEVLIADVRKVNDNLIELTESLRQLAHERERAPIYRRFFRKRTREV